MNQSRIKCIIQARMSSTRLPGKVLMKINNEPIILIIVKRLSLLFPKEEIIIATTIKPTDNPLLNFCEKEHLNVYRGDEDDVLGRIIGASEKFNAEHIVRITADNPFVSVELINILVKEHIKNKSDYTTFELGKLPIGVSSEVFSVSALKKSYHLEKSSYFLEEMNEFIINNPHLVRTFYISVPKTYIKTHIKNYRLTVDTIEDFNFANSIIDKLGINANLKQIIDYIKKNKSNLPNLNIKQKDNLIKYPHFIFRVDASNKIGSGHIQRCLLLVGQLKKRVNCKITFMIKDYMEAVNKIKEYKYLINTILINQDLSEDDELKVIAKEKPYLLITDIMNLSEFYISKLSGICSNIISIDDLGNKYLNSNLIINCNPIAKKEMYPNSNEKNLLLGTDYLLIDPKYSYKKIIKKEVKNILVSLGGSDDHSLVLKVIDALNKLNEESHLKNNFLVHFVIGPGFKDHENLKIKLQNFKWLYNTYYGLKDILKVLKKCDCAIISGGFTKYEVSASGTPSLVLCQEDFELEISKVFENKGSIVVAGLGTELSVEHISQQIEQLLTNFELRKDLNKKRFNLNDGFEKIINRIISDIYPIKELD